MHRFKFNVKNKFHRSVKEINQTHIFSLLINCVSNKKLVEKVVYKGISAIKLKWNDIILPLTILPITILPLCNPEIVDLPNSNQWLANIIR